MTRLFHWIFEWDCTGGFSCYRVNYGPIDVTAKTWIVPGTIEEEEPLSCNEEPKYEWEEGRFDRMRRTV